MELELYAFLYCVKSIAPYISLNSKHFTVRILFTWQYRHRWTHQKTIFESIPSDKKHLFLDGTIIHISWLEEKEIKSEDMGLVDEKGNT